MKDQSPGIRLLREAFGQQNYQIQNESYKKKLLQHPLIQGMYTIGSSFVILANTHNWEIEAVTGETLNVAGYTADEIMSIGGEFVMNFTIPEHIPMNMATLKACMEYSNSCPVEERNRIFAVYLYTARKKNGDPVTIQHQSIPLVFDAQMIPFVFCNVYNDISYLDAYNIPQGLMINKHTREVFYLDPKTMDLEKRKELFSDREKEVIRFLINGLTSPEIAQRLNISKDTVRTHRKNILGKAGISNTASLIKYSILNGVLS